MDLREQRGREIAERAKIVKMGNAWVVPSASGNGTYRVTLDGKELACTCPDYELRAKPCKHIFAAAIIVQRQTVIETQTPNGVERTTVTETAVRLTYSQNWPAYNKAQTKEKELFCRLLRDLVSTVPQPEQGRGRPRIPVADALFCAGFKVYSGMSGRRFATDLREAHAAGLVSNAWHYNPVLRVIADPELTPTLYDLVTATAAPLGSVEESFAIDSTGFGVHRFYRHFAHKYGEEKERRDWLKLHALVGVKTNVIGACRVTDRTVADTNMFEPLAIEAAETFDMKEIMADKGYCSRKNVTLAADLGATPYIAMLSSSRSYLVRPGRSQHGRPPVKDSMAWRWLYHLYNMERDTFLARYHQRSNVESTFSSLKRVFGDTLRSKTFEAQVNELLLTVIAHNIRCLVHSIFELGIQIPGLPLNGSGCPSNPVAEAV